MPRNKLTERQRLFVVALLGEAQGNATRAAQKAGCTRQSAATMAWKWLRKVKVQQAIAERVARREKRTNVTNDEIDQFLVGIMDNDGSDEKNRISAAKELNRTRGRHSMKHVVEAGATLQQLLAASWKK